MTFTRNCWRLGIGLVLTGAIGSGVLADPPTEPGKLPVGDPPSDITPVVAKVVSATPTVNGAEALPKALAEAKTVYAKTRDYSGYMVRQERIGGKLQPEQTAEIRVRVAPFAIFTKTIAPKSLLGQELAFMTGKKDDKVRVRAAGVAGVSGYAYRMVMYVDNVFKLPVRFEAYDATKTGDSAGEMFECVSFVSLKLNGGLGDAVFER